MQAAHAAAARLSPACAGINRTLVSVGNAILEEWRKEADSTTQESNGTEGEPFHVQSLSTRLGFLDTIREQVDGHVGQHIISAVIEQKQLEGTAQLRGQNIPLLAEQTATLVRQVEQLQRAAVISGFAKATREAARTEGDTNLLAAQQTMAAIENLVGSTQEALTKMSEAASKVSAHMAMKDPGPKRPPPALLSGEFPTPPVGG